MTRRDTASRLSVRFQHCGRGIVRAEMYRVFGESLANYTPAKTALLLKEAGMEDTADKSFC